MKNKVITVFGSSVPKADEAVYKTAYKLGYELAKAGFSIATGGYFGIMEAASKGAYDAGGYVYGITLPVFGSKPNKYITDEIECGSLYERIGKLISIAEGFVVFEGGTGTLVELAMAWELMNKKIQDTKPIICMGEFWDNLITDMNKRMEYEKRSTDIVQSVDTYKECVNKLVKKLK